MLFCGTCGMMVRTETNICPKCSSTLTAAYVSGGAKAGLARRGKLGGVARVLAIGGIVLLLAAVAAAVSYRAVMRPGRSIYMLPEGNVMGYINFAPMHLMNVNASSYTATPEYQQIVNETGLHVEHDIENIAIAANADGGPSKDVAIIVTGTFDQQRLNGYVRKQEGLQTETYGGKTVFSSSLSDQNVHLCILDSRMVAVTISPALESIHAIIDKSAGSGSAPNLFENYYGDVPFASPIWAIVHVPSFAVTDSPAGGMNLNFLKNSVTIVSARYFGSLQLRGEFIAENQSDATNIFQAANGLLAMSKLAGSPRPNDPDLTALMNSIEVKQSGAHVVVSLAVPPEMLQKIAQKR